MKKKLKLNIPKRIAGVKLPKRVRKGPVADFINSSAGQLLVAEALIVLGGALANARRNPDSPTGEFLRHPIKGVKQARRAASRKAADASDALARESGRLSHAFSEAIRAFRTTLEQGTPAEQEAALQNAGDVIEGEAHTEPERAKKKPAASHPETSSTPH